MPPSSPSTVPNATTMSSAAAPPLSMAVGQAGGIPKGRPKSPRGVSTLMYACQQGDVEKVRRLLRAQPTALEKRDRTGKTALHYCCTSDSLFAAQAADLLVMAAPDLVESRDEDGFTPLHLAVIAGNMPLVTFLLANNADVNAVDSEKHTVVHWATVCGETGALRAVLAAGAPVSTPDIHGGYPLHYAAQMCGGEKDSSLGLQVLQTLLQHPDIKVNAEDGEGRQPLLWASSAGSAKAVLALIRAGSTVDASDKDGLTALHCAASRGHSDCIDTLLTLCGMSPDVIDSNGCTALHYSVTLGHADATALLLAHGADPNRQDRKGRSSAHCGCAKGQFETVKLIGSNNANLWLRNARGDLPLHEAAASGRRDLVKWLLEARPSQVNARNNDGRCPLHLAALNDNADMCKILLDAGAQVNPVLRTSKNVFMTPLDCALQRGFRSTAKYLQLHGGVPASRMSTSKMKIPNGVPNVHLREDPALWGGESTSDSERENGDKDERTQRRHRRRVNHRHHDKKKESAAVISDDETKRTSATAERDKQRAFRNGNNKSGGNNNKKKNNGKIAGKSKDNVTYNSEVKITNNYGGINIERNGEIIIGSDGYPIIQGSSPKAAASKAKMDAKIRQISEDRDNPDPETPNDEEIKDVDVNTDELHPTSDSNNNNKMEMTQTPQQTKPELNIDGNIEEIKTLATTIEQTAKSITQEVIHIQQNLHEDMIKLKQIDQHSLISNTSLEESEHKELIVEAAVHEPPKETTKEESPREEADASEEIRQDLEAEQPQTSIIEDSPDAIEVKEEKQEETPREEEPPPIPDNDQDALNINEDNPTEIETEQKLDSPKQEDEKPESDETKIESPKDQSEIDSPKSVDDKIQETTDQIEDEKPTVATSKDDGSDISIETPDTVKLADRTLDDQKTLSDPEQKIESIEDENKLDETAAVTEEIVAETEEIAAKLEETAAETEENAAETEENAAKTEEIAAIIEETTVIIEETVVVTAEESPKEKVEEEPVKGEETASSKEETSSPKDETTSPKIPNEFSAEGVTAVNVESKTNKEQKKKFLKEKKAKKGEDATPKERSKRDRTPRPDESTRETKASKKEKIKTEGRSKEKLTSDRKEKMEKNGAADSTRKERRKEKIPTKAIEKILEVTQCGTSPIEETQEKLKKRKKLMEDRTAKKKGKPQEERSDDDFSTSSSDSITKKKKKHRSFTVLENGVEQRRVRIAKSRSPKRDQDEVEETKPRKSRIPVISKLRREISISDQQLDRDFDDDDTRISLPNLLDERRYGSKTADLSALPPPPSLRQSAYSDNERSASDAEEVTRSATRRRRLRKRMKRDSRSAGSDYESSNLIDSGFEPSPRSSRIPKWKNMTERGVCMTSVTQSIQSNIRRYHLERKIFQHLLELKRLQIRSGQHNETVLVKRAIDEYHNSCVATVGAGRYVPEDYSFKSFEKFLYHSLRKLQKDGTDYLKGLPETPTNNPLLCTQSTHRCSHATHAYTGIPCAAYLPKMDHHTIPKIGYPCKPSGFLPHINQKKTVTLELCHGSDKQVISLPTDKLDQNKRYYVTFTVKGNDPPSPSHKEQTDENAHRHAKSV